jgi:hypothetical protein
MKLCLVLLAVSCTGSPDSVTLYGGHGVSTYDSPSGARSYNSDSNEVGVGLTWALPTVRSMRQDADSAEMLRLFRSMEQRQREATQPVATNVTVTSPTVELPPDFGKEPAKDDSSVQIRGAVSIAILAAAAALTALLKKMIAKRKKPVAK